MSRPLAWLIFFAIVKFFLALKKARLQQKKEFDLFFNYIWTFSAPKELDYNKNKAKL
jgi:hypothetical protein